MFKITNPKKDKEPTDLDELITSHIKSMDGIGPETEEYTNAANALKTLMEARRVEEETYSPWRPDANTVAAVAGHLIGIFAILSFEKVNVITTKSLAFVPKIRV